MKYWIDWLVRESVAVIAVNVICLGAALLAGRLGAHPTVPYAAALSASMFVVLSALNVASARRHAEPGQRLYWPGLAVYETLAIAAAAAIWSIGSSA